MKFRKEISLDYGINTNFFFSEKKISRDVADFFFLKKKKFQEMWQIFFSSRKKNPP